MANKYSMDNDPAVKSYQVEGDKAINEAGFSNQTEREKELKKEIGDAGQGGLQRHS